MRRVIVETRGEEYIVICRVDKLYKFKKGEEGKIVELVMEFLGEDAVHNDNTGRV